MQKQSLTTSCQQTNAQPDLEQRLLWRNSLPIHYKMCHYVVCSISLGSSGQLCQMCSLPQPIPRWQGADQGRTKAREGLDAVPALLSNSKSTAVLPRLSWPQMPNTAPHQLLWRTLTPSQPDPAKSDICLSTHLLHFSSELLSPSFCPQCVNPSRQRQQELTFHTDKFVRKKKREKSYKYCPWNDAADRPLGHHAGTPAASVLTALWQCRHSEPSLPHYVGGIRNSREKPRTRKSTENLSQLQGSRDRFFIRMGG